jgi:Flp pilus assembly protein TadG
MTSLEIRRRSRPGRTRSGQALVEFVITLPILLLLIFGMMDFARAWSAHHAIADATREGTRLVVVQDYGELEARSRIQDRLREAGLDAASADIFIFRNGQSWDGSTRTRGDTMTVKVDYPYDFWLLGPLIGWTTGERLVNLVSTTTMRGE